MLGNLALFRTSPTYRPLGIAHMVLVKTNAPQMLIFSPIIVQTLQQSLTLELSGRTLSFELNFGLEVEEDTLT